MIIGRVITLHSEDQTKLRETNVGLINSSDDSQTNVFKVKLNLSECPEYSLFEGEVIVC